MYADATHLIGWALLYAAAVCLAVRLGGLRERFDKLPDDLTDSPKF